MASLNQQSAQAQVAEDKAEAALKMLEKENAEFNNHWVWRELQTTPDKFFENVKAHVKTLGIPEKEWNEMYNKTKEAHRIRALEKRNAYRPMNLKLIGSIRV